MTEFLGELSLEVSRSALYGNSYLHRPQGAHFQQQRASRKRPKTEDVILVKFVLLVSFHSMEPNFQKLHQKCYEASKSQASLTDCICICNQVMANTCA